MVGRASGSGGGSTVVSTRRVCSRAPGPVGFCEGPIALERSEPACFETGRDATGVEAEAMRALATGAEPPTAATLVESCSTWMSKTNPVLGGRCNVSTALPLCWLHGTALPWPSTYEAETTSVPGTGVK